MKKIIVISGGGDGLGLSIAEKLSSQNTVIILGRTQEKLVKAAQKLSCQYLVCDVSIYTDCQNSIKKIIKEHNKIDCLINNAALWIQGELDQNEPENIKQVVDVNTTGTIFLTKATLPVMKKEKSGTIINIISQAGLYGKAERSIYTATKFALTGFTKSLQPEVAKYNIRVTGIYPGKLKTGLFSKVGITKDFKDALHPEEVAEAVKFILSLKHTTLIPELGTKLITN